MEAMAAGLPVVAVDASGTRDIVDNGKQGMLVENDADALANVINRLFRSPKRMENYGKNALKKAETFTVRKCTELLVDVYKQAIQDKADGQNVQVEEIEPT
jgi:glycosyltransferase involved in cell wall biosynthesis